jgi:Ca2+-binding RTX toxin-like protein
MGNSGDNVLTGGGGDDQIDGSTGSDTAIFSGAYAEYELTTHEGFVTVRDLNLDRDGTDLLTSVESLQFSDRTIER